MPSDSLKCMLTLFKTRLFKVERHLTSSLALHINVNENYKGHGMESKKEKKKKNNNERNRNGTHVNICFDNAYSTPVVHLRRNSMRIPFHFISRDI